MHSCTPQRVRAALPRILAAVAALGATQAFVSVAHAQTTEASQPTRRARITGRVLDAASNQPLAAANIFVLGTPITATTGPDGRFSIASAPVGIFTIEAKRLGYGASRVENVRLRADSVTTLEFKLTDRPMMLDQVTVAATVDAQSVAKSTFATSVVDADQMPVPSTASAASMISGKVAGVNITRPSGRPGSGVNILLRSPIGGFDQAGGAAGNGSAPGPLFVVDGVFLNASQQTTTQDIEGMDVASIEVIKGAAAAALYGARAAAGVISITTNRGKNLSLGTTQFTFRTEYGVDSYLTDLQKNTHHQFLQDANGNWLDATGNIVPRASRVVKPLGIMDAPYTTPLYDNAGQLFKTSRLSTQTAGVSGNFAASNYYVSYTRTAQPGVVKYNEGYKRQSIKLNIDSRPGEKVTLGVSATHERGYDAGSPVNFTTFYNFDADVNLLAPDPFPKFGFPYKIVPDSVSLAQNPLYTAFVYDNRTRRARTQLNVQGSYRPATWLSMSGNASYDRGDLQRTQYTARGTPTTSNGTLGTSTGSLVIETDITDGYTFKGGPTITKAFGPMTVRLSDLGQVQREQNPFIQSTGTNFVTEGVKAMSQAGTKAVTQSYTDTRSINNITTLGFSIYERYIGDFLINREGNSRFGRANRWNTFGRASGAWLLHDEKFFPFQDQFQQFKLRYSYGIAGYAPGFSQQYEALASDGNGGITRSTLGNPNIAPLKNYESEFGIDFTFLNRFQGQFTYARNHTINNFIAVPAPAVAGYCCVTRNPGENAGQTLEGTLNARLIDHPKGLQVSMNIIADKSRNIITAFRRSCFIDGINYRCEGIRDGTFWGHKMVTDLGKLPASAKGFESQFQTNDEGYVVAVGTGNTWRDGVAKNLWGTNVVVGGKSYGWGLPFVQVDSVGSAANLLIGDGNPTMHYGIQPDFRYKGFRLNFLLDGKIGGNTYDNSDQGFYNSCDAPVCDQYGRADELKKPVAYYKAVANSNSDYQQAFVRTGTFARLSEMILTYSLDAKKLGFVRALGFNRADISIIGRNLKYWTKYEGLNVDGGTPSSRIDDATYPLTRTWTGAITLTF